MRGMRGGVKASRPSLDLEAWYKQHNQPGDGFLAK